MEVFTYEYVTIHLITDNAAMEEVREPMLDVAAGRGTEVSDSWNKHQLEMTPGFG